MVSCVEIYKEYCFKTLGLFMKIGILTLHSQLNYGAILQCWALQEYLSNLGHDVVVLDRWSRSINYAFVGAYMNLLPFKWIFTILRILLRQGGLAYEIRRFKTQRFLRKVLHISSFHFYDWNEVPDDIGIDCLVVGSDQVFNYADEPDVYLLENAPNIKAICYAASFGGVSIPDGVREKYMRGLRRFYAISCRERQGVEICKQLGFDAVQVCDPTLLHSRERWCKFVELCANKNEKLLESCRLVCYLIDEGYDIQNVIFQCAAFAEAMHCIVEVFLHDYSVWRWRKRLPNVKNVVVRLSADPKDFLVSISSAKWVISNAFHGLMFSIIFRRNVRILSPISAKRASMFSRIKSYELYSSGSLIVDDVATALKSFLNNESVTIDLDKLMPMINKSHEYLISKLNKSA